MEDNKKYYKYVEDVSKPWESLNRIQKNFIGTKYTTKYKNTLTVVGVCDLSKKTKFILECDTCSEDRDLWFFGSIQSRKGDLIRDKSCCSCGRLTLWSEKQYIVLINKRCKEEGYIFKGWEGSFGRANITYLNLYNPETGNSWTSCTIKSFLHNNTRDPLLSGTKDDDGHSNDFMSTGKFPVGSKFWRSSLGGRLFNYICPVCSKDKYVGAGLCSGVFTSAMCSLKLGKKPCRCTPPFYWTQEQREFQIKEVLVNGTFVGWVGSGFNTKLSATFYIVEWYGYGESYLKYGITNKTVLQRIKVQARKSHLDYKVLYTFYNDSGQAVLDVENKVKGLYGRAGVCPKQWLPDGFTETVHNTSENLAILLSLTSTLQ